MSHPADIASLSAAKLKAPFEVEDAFIRALSPRIHASSKVNVPLQQISHFAPRQGAFCHLLLAHDFQRNIHLCEV